MLIHILIFMAGSLTGTLAMCLFIGGKNGD